MNAEDMERTGSRASPPRWAPWPHLGPAGERAPVTVLRALLCDPDPDVVDAELAELVDRDPVGVVAAVRELEQLITGVAARSGLPSAVRAGLVTGWLN